MKRHPLQSERRAVIKARRFLRVEFWCDGAAPDLDSDPRRRQGPPGGGGLDPIGSVPASSLPSVFGGVR